MEIREEVKKDTLETTADGDNIEKIIEDFLNNHPEENGWSVGIPRVDPLGNGMFKISIECVLYNVNKECKMNM